MGTNIPRTIPGFLNWAAVHADVWQEHASEVGISDGQAAEFRERTERVAEAQRQAAIARQASLSATENLRLALESARDMAGTLVRVVKARAEITNDLNVYVLGSVSPADEPGAVAAPVPPHAFDASMNSDGSLLLTWKASQPAGVTDVQYQIHRRLRTESNPRAAFEILSTAGSNKTFTDRTIPLGSPRVEYMLMPTRGRTVGQESRIFSIQFGSAPPSGTTMAHETTLPRPLAVRKVA